MNRLLPAALLGAIPVAMPAHGERAAAPPEVALKRVNLLVRDMERSLAIYRDILGFRLFHCSDSGPQSVSYPVFRSPAQAQLEAAGLDVIEPRRSRTAEGRDFSELAFADPDGHLVVLYQLD